MDLLLFGLLVLTHALGDDVTRDSDDSKRHENSTRADDRTLEEGLPHALDGLFDLREVIRHDSLGLQESLLVHRRVSLENCALDCLVDRVVFLLAHFFSYFDESIKPL